MTKGEINKKLLLAAANDAKGRRRPFEEWYKSQNKYARYRIRKAFVKLEKKGLLDTSRDANGNLRVALTETGSREAAKYKLDALTLVPLPRWDGKWRIIISDEKLPAKEKNTLKNKFSRLGLCELQKNVWAYPHACQTEVKLISEALGVYPKIKFMETDFLENDRDLKIFFGLS